MDLIKKIYNWQFFRFALTGALNTAVGYILYVIGYYITKNETYALIFDYVLSILFNFKSYSILVFNNKKNSKIFIFTFVYIGVFLLNRISLYFFIDQFRSFRLVRNPS
jgi:putative flippase GtrA